MDIWQVSVEGYPHTKAFNTVAMTLQKAVTDLGFASGIDHRAEKYVKNWNGVVLGAHLLKGELSDCIVYNLEQITPESPLVNEHYLSLLRKNRVWDYSKRNIAELKKLGVDAVHMPVGYHSCLAKIPKGYLPQIDCLFYGSVNERRKIMLESVMATPVFGIYGKKLDVCIASSKIILNCHYYETKLFEIVRCSYLLANKRFILSEPGLDLELEAPFKEGIAFHERSEWPEAVKYYLQNDDVREKIANKGFEIFSNMKQTDYLKDESKSW